MTRFILKLLFISVIAFADEIYVVDNSNDIELLKQSGWILVEENLSIEKTVNINKVKIFEYKNPSTSECKSVKKGCTSSR